MLASELALVIGYPVESSPDSDRSQMFAHPGNNPAGTNRLHERCVTPNNLQPICCSTCKLAGWLAVYSWRGGCSSIMHIAWVAPGANISARDELLGPVMSGTWGIILFRSRSSIADFRALPRRSRHSILPLPRLTSMRFLSQREERVRFRLPGGTAIARQIDESWTPLLWSRSAIAANAADTCR